MLGFFCFFRGFLLVKRLAVCEAFLRNGVLKCQSIFAFWPVFCFFTRKNDANGHRFYFYEKKNEAPMHAGRLG